MDLHLVSTSLHGYKHHVSTLMKLNNVFMYVVNYFYKLALNFSKASDIKFCMSVANYLTMECMDFYYNIAIARSQYYCYRQH